MFLSISSSYFFTKGKISQSQTFYAKLESGCRSANVIPILARTYKVEGIKQTKMMAKVSKMAQKIQQMRYFLRCFVSPLSKVMQVKQAGTQQHPTPTTIDMAFDMKVTIIRNTRAASTKALGFIPVFLKTNSNYFASSSLFSFKSFVTCSIIYYILYLSIINIFWVSYQKQAQILCIATTYQIQSCIINKIVMIGSLGQFLPLQANSILAQQYQSDRPNHHLLPLRTSKRRGKSTFDSYTPQDKTDLLVRYEKNNIYNINRKKYNSIEKQAASKQTFKRPLYQHHSFFVKAEITKDYISKQELKRKHNLLRAIMRMKKNQQGPKGESDYQQSFRRLYSGFKSTHPNPIMERKEETIQKEQIGGNHKIIPVLHTRSKSTLPNQKRLQFQYCLSWAKKHKKNGYYFAQQLGKVQKNHQDEDLVINRSLIDEIGKKLDLSWLE